MYSSKQIIQLKKGQLGLSLVELIIALGLGVIILLGTSQAMLNMSVSSRTQTEKNDLEQTANIALSYIGQKMRSSLATPCERINEIRNKNRLTIHPLGTVGKSALLNAKHAEKLFKEKGFIIKKEKTKVGKVETETDAIFTFSTGAPVKIIGETGILTPKIKIAGSNPFDEKDILFALSTCENMDIFSIKNSSANSGNTIFTPNVKKGLYINYRDLESAMLAPLIVSKFHVEKQKLKEVQLNKNTNNNELLDGIELIRVLFGVDSSGNDGIVDRFITSSQLNSLSATEQLVSIQLYILVSANTQKGNLDVADSYTISLPDTSKEIAQTIPQQELTFEDKILRRVFTKTITLRNSVGM